MSNQKKTRFLAAFFALGGLFNIAMGEAISADIIAKCPSGKSLSWVKQGSMKPGSTSVFEYGKDIVSLKVVNNGADHTAWESGSTSIILGSVMSGASVRFKGYSERCAYQN